MSVIDWARGTPARHSRRIDELSLTRAGIDCDRGIEIARQQKANAVVAVVQQCGSLLTTQPSASFIYRSTGVTVATADATWAGKLADEGIDLFLDWTDDVNAEYSTYASTIQAAYTTMTETIVAADNAHAHRPSGRRLGRR